MLSVLFFSKPEIFFRPCSQMSNSNALVKRFEVENETEGNYLVVDSIQGITKMQFGKTSAMPKRDKGREWHCGYYGRARRQPIL